MVDGQDERLKRPAARGPTDPFYPLPIAFFARFHVAQFCGLG
jgi:hypothetical protein